MIGNIARYIFRIKDEEYNQKEYDPAVTRGDMVNYDDLLSQKLLSIGGVTANHGNTAYVSVDGNDTTGEIGNISKPFATLQTAIDALDPALTAHVIIVSTNGFQSEFASYNINSGSPYEITIHDLTQSGIILNGSSDYYFGKTRIITSGSVVLSSTASTIAIDDNFNVDCQSFIIPSTHETSVTFNGLIRCDSIIINTNANNPTLIFDRVLWITYLNIRHPITYNIMNPTVYKAIITQNGNDDPVVATLLENTLQDAITFERTGFGTYSIENTSGLFTKTIVSFSPAQNYNAFRGPIFTYEIVDQTQIDFEVYDSTNASLDDVIGDTGGTVIQIQVYP
jgi:hypothetical protein